MSSERYEKLRRMAESATASPAEREMAKKLMERMEAEHPKEALIALVWRLTPASRLQQQLVIHLCATHAARLDQEAGTFIVSGPTRVVQRVEFEFLSYAPVMDEMENMLLLASLKAWNVYCENPPAGVRPEGGGEAPAPKTHFEKVPGHIVEAMLKSNFQLAKTQAVPDLRLKQLPPSAKKDPLWFMQQLMGRNPW